MPTHPSGTVWKVVDVTPWGLMKVAPTKHRYPISLQDDLQAGESFAPCETKYTGPSNATGRLGTTACARPIADSGGHDAGFA